MRARFSIRSKMLAIWVGIVVITHNGPAAGVDRETRRVFEVSARRYAIEPRVLRVMQHDTVEIRFRATDIAHSLVIDHYRIARRANAGETVVIEFLATKPGRFTLYCNLAFDEGCRHTRAELVVGER